MEKILQEIGSIILDTGDFALEFWKNGNFKTEQVLHRSLESMDFKAIDREITEQMAKKLSALGITDRFLTEEGMDDARYNQTGGLRWVCDELDGTSNFASGESDWGHSIALEKDGETIYAALFTPVRGELLLASQAEVYFLDTYGTKPSDVKLDLVLSKSFKTSELRYRLPQHSAIKNPLEKIRCYVHPGRKRNFELSPQNPINRLYSQLANPACTFSCTAALAKVALGKLDAAVIGFQNYWDIAAGRHIIEKAGGSFTAYRLANYVNAPWPELRLNSNDYAKAYAVDSLGQEWQCHIIAAVEKEIFDALRKFMST